MQLNYLGLYVLLMSIVVIFGFFNEKVTHLPNEIALMLYSVLLGGVAVVIHSMVDNNEVQKFITDIQTMSIERFLLNGVLCFMLFAGSCHIKISDFRGIGFPVAILSIVCTTVGAILYGALFYGASCLFHMGISFYECLMFGSIVAPTDPIAATSILSKFGLPEKTCILIEGESLFNDGVGVALFAVFSGLVRAQREGNFFEIMGRELFGAIAVGALITFILFPLFLNTEDATRKIFISTLTVSLSYVFCEHFGFSGAIASVTCGILFGSLRYVTSHHEKEEHSVTYDSFWEVVDALLNSILYVLMGLSMIRTFTIKHVLFNAVIAIAANLIARTASLWISSCFMRRIPDGFTRKGFITLLTWGGLRGGLSIALAMSTSSMLNENIYYIIFGATYAIVFFTTVVQGLSMKKVYDLIKPEGQDS